MRNHVFIEGDLMKAIRNDNQDSLLDVDALATFFKVPKSKIYSLTRETGENSIPRYKIGRNLRFNLKEVMDWLKSKREGSVSHSE